MTAVSSHDGQIVELIKSHDEDGLRKLLQRHGGPVRDELIRKFRDEEIAHESLQDAVLTIWYEKAAELDANKNVRAFLFYIAHNKAIDKLRKKLRELEKHQRYTEEVIRTMLSYEFGNENGSSNSKPKVKQLLDAIHSLPPMQRAIMQNDLENGGDPVPAQKLANLLGTSEDAIYTNRSYAKRKLRERLQHEGYFGDSLE